MKKRFIFVSALAAVFFYFVHSCTNEDYDGTVNDRKDQLLEDAMRKYYGKTVDDGIMELRTTAEVGGLMVRPAWDLTDLEEDGDQFVLNIALLAERGFSFATPESAEMAEKKKDKRHRMSKTSFVYTVDKTTGKEEMFIMTVVPDHSFIQSTNFKPFDDMYYKKREKNFKGYVFYHDLEGRFVNGWRYIGGKVKGTMRAHTEKPDFDVVTTRSGNSCEYTYLVYYWEQCTDWITLNNGEMWESCDYWETWQYWYTTCPEYGDGGYCPFCDGGGAGGVQDPPPPPPPPACTSGSVGKTLNNSMLTNVAINSGMHSVLLGKMSASNEWAVSIGKSGSTYSVSAPLEGGASSGSAPPVPSGDFFAYGHSHPNNSDAVPSAGDVYCFLEKVRDNASLQTMYVYGKGWNNSTEIYAINVHDRSKVVNFLNQYPKSSNYDSVYVKFDGIIGDAYDIATNRYNEGNYDSHNVSYQYMKNAVALSFIMNQYNMGVTLTRKVDNANFKTISSVNRINSSGISVIDITVCGE